MTTEESSPTAEIIPPEPIKVDKLKGALARLLLICDDAPELLSDILPYRTFESETSTEPSYQMKLDTWCHESELAEYSRRLRRVARNLAMPIGSVTKFADDDYFGVELVIEQACRLRVMATRSSVCVQVPTGETRTVTKRKLITPAVPAKYEDEEVIEDVMEWVCPPSILGE